MSPLNGNLGRIFVAQFADLTFLQKFARVLAKNNHAFVVHQTKRAILSKAFDKLGARISSRWKLSELSIARAFLLTKRASHEVDISRIL